MRAFVFIAALAAAAGAHAQSIPSSASSSARADELIPPGQVVVQTIQGDLNKDGVPDVVLLIKGTDTSRFVTDPSRGRLDRNRRGLVIAFGAKDGYTLALSHRDCFSSENEDGGVYYAPELDVTIRKGTLRVSYAHGRYGYWAHTFRHQNGDFELIGYDSSENRGPVVLTETSMNFSTRKARIRTNTNPTGDGGDEKFRESWKSFVLDAPIRLRDVPDFDEFGPARLLEPARR